MEILEQIDILVQSVEERIRRLADENQSLRADLEIERRSRAEEKAGMEQKLGVLLARLRAVLVDEGQDQAG
ncbi:MAG: hypothetical protein ACC613_09425 [Synergistales bacterium]